MDAALRIVARRAAKLIRGGVGLVSPGGAEAAGDVELVECGSLVATTGAGHQNLHKDYNEQPEGAGAALKLGPRLVIFLALDDVPDVGFGATVFDTRANGPRASTPLRPGDLLVYDAALPHFGAAKSSGPAPRAVFYSSWAAALSEPARRDGDRESQLALGKAAERHRPVPPPTLSGLAR